MTGYFNVSITFDASHTFISAGSTDMYIVKYNPNGNVVWAKSAGGSNSDVGNSVAVDASGYCYVAGYFDSPNLTFGTSLTNTGGNDIFIVKYDIDGSVLWAKSVGGKNDDRAYSIAIDPLGNCFMTGYFVSPTITFGSTTLTNSGATDMYFVKYAPNGTVLWAKSAIGTSTGFEYATSIAIDILGNSYVTGHFSSNSLIFGSVILTKVSNFDMYVVKYSPNGTVLWANNASVVNRNPSSVAVDTAGNCYVAGFFNGNTIIFGTTTLTNFDNQHQGDVFLVKYAPNGIVLWAKSAGGPFEDGASGVAVDKSGNCYLTGFFKSPTIVFGLTTLTNKFASRDDIFVTEYDPNGTVKWSKSAGGAGDDYVNSIAVDKSTNFYLAGYFSSPDLIFGSITLISVGSNDMFIVKSDNISGLNEVKNTSSISFFPNPSTDIITVILSQKSIIEILNIQGQICKTINCNDTKTTIDISNLSTGVYILKSTTDKGIALKKLIKQ